jgi:cutinase
MRLSLPLRSQGTAVMHNAVSTLDPTLKSKLSGGVLFGDTRNKQDKGQIPNFPKDKVTIFCDKNDGVCGGMLNVNAGHFAYTQNGDGEKAVAFLKGKIDPLLGKKRV